MRTAFDNFFKDKKVFVTGHTGFKGSWLCVVLHHLGARVYGYSLAPPTEPNLYTVARVDKLVQGTTGDIRNYEQLLSAIRSSQPDIVIHMAAQSLVLPSYSNPRETYDVNVMGTVNLLEAVRYCDTVKAVVNVTTDKCYENRESLHPYRESEPLGGYDPYSASKACSELVTSSFRSSFFNPESHSEHGAAIASARAGNVIGGGDWAANRLLPDIFRAIMNNERVQVRNPRSIRPWQHVMEPLSGYLLLAKLLFNDGTAYADAWNFGPGDSDTRDVESIVKTICEIWGEGADYNITNGQNQHEAAYLRLDSSKAAARLNWTPRWDINSALASTVGWHRAWHKGEDMLKVTLAQVDDFLFNPKNLQ